MVVSIRVEPERLSITRTKFDIIQEYQQNGPMVKTQDQIKKVFYVDRGDFLRKTMEFALKPKGVDVYTVETMENNFYLLDDLLPDVIVFDVKTARPYLENLRAYGQKARLVAVGDEEDRPLVQDYVALFLPKPLIAATLANSLLSLVD